MQNPVSRAFESLAKRWHAAFPPAKIGVLLHKPDGFGYKSDYGYLHIGAKLEAAGTYTVRDQPAARHVIMGNVSMTTNGNVRNILDGLTLADAIKEIYRRQTAYQNARDFSGRSVWSLANGNPRIEDVAKTHRVSLAGVGRKSLNEMMQVL